MTMKGCPQIIWSEEEIKILKENYKGNFPGVRCLAKLPQKTLAAIHGKARSLNLTKHRLNWTEEEEKLLKKTYLESESVKHLSEQLGKSYCSVITKAYKQGLSRKIEKKEILPLTEAQKAYLAGIIDGEGSLTIVKNKSGKLWPILSITQKNPQLLYWIKNTIGHGYICRRKRDIYHFYLRRQSLIKDLLGLIKPYLILKRKQAEILIQFCENRLKNRYYTKQDFDLEKKIKEANH